MGGVHVVAFPHARHSPPPPRTPSMKQCVCPEVVVMWVDFVWRESGGVVN